MLGRKATRITELEGVVAAQQAQIEALESDPVVAWVRTMQDEVAGMVGVDGMPLSATALEVEYTNRVGARRQGLIAERAGALASEAIAADKLVLDKTAEDAAASSAEQTRKTFWESGEADRYRAAAAAQFTTSKNEEVTRAAQQQIDDEERVKAVATEKARLEAEQAADLALKPRADKLRDRSRITRMVQLGDLEAADILTIKFVAAEDAFNEVISSTQVCRTVVVRLLNKELGSSLFEIQADSLFGTSAHQRAMWGGSKRHLVTDDPLSPDVEEVPVIVQGKPLAFVTPEGEVDRTPWTVGTVQLGSHRLL